MYKKIIITTCLLFSTQAIAQKTALLVGVSDYGGDPRNDLPGIDLDISKMQQIFRSWGFDNIKVLPSHSSLQTKDYLRNYASTLNSSDTFAFYYSGHGSFTIDKNGDEADGKDEALVLSDGKINIPLIDDELGYYLNKIQAKKLIIFDSCHSGTVNKGNSNTVVPKTLPTNQLDTTITKGIKIGKDINSGNYIVLSASQDDEESLATQRGSLFTNELYRMFSNPNSNKSLESIREEIGYDIETYCKRTPNKPHHPKFSFSNPSYKNISIKKYLALGKTTTPTQPIEITLQNRLDNIVQNSQNNQITISNKKSSYSTGEFVNFNINTNNQKGYLTMLYIDKNDITVLYPNPRLTSKPIQGSYNFPKDFGNFKIRAFKQCKSCPQEKTSIYLLLTPQPLGNIENMSRNKMLSFAKGSTTDSIISKAVEVVDEPIKSSSSGYLIGKYEFLVY